MKILKEQNLITSYNFARGCNKVFVEAVTHDQYEMVKTNSSKIVGQNKEMIIYKNTNIEIHENDSIFCHSSFIKELFFHLKKIKNLNNLKLITSQSDVQINKQLYRIKPDCISEWYSINVNYKAKNLIPIPLGLANNYSPKNIRFLDLRNNKSREKKKINRIYCNFNPNTNDKERQDIFHISKKDKIFSFDQPSLSISEYINRIDEHKYVLAPWGNGFDTHRVWEALYLGSIPIIKRHITYQYLDENSILFIDEYEDINKPTIENFEKRYSELNKEILNIQFWIMKIHKNKVISNEKSTLIESKFMTIYRIAQQKLFYKIESYKKKIRYYFKKILKAYSKIVERN
tara:strand:+ start:4393 stop:5427 length:1035 start_codon:yes stop_codon:yes gene_type:complete